MPRLVRHDAMGPVKIEPQDKAIFVCACGLSQNFPFCDGAHKGCKAELPDRLYVYDEERRQVREVRDDGTRH